MTEEPTILAQNAALLRWVRFIAIALLVLAIYFRFTNLDGKVYWHDEAYTSMVITANSLKYLVADLFQNKLATPEDLLAYQNFVPGLTLTDMLVRKGIEDVQHPPIFYVLLRWWTQIWGTAPAITRWLASLLSLLIFPAVYWLCLELFESRLSGWIAVALFAVSPIHLVFGQEVREFGFWAAQALVCSALLLRAIRLNDWGSWALYGLSMVTAFYTALFSLGVAVGHFFYVLFLDRRNRLFSLPPRINKYTISYIATMSLVVVCFIPWIYFIVLSSNTLGATTSWTSVSLPFLIYLQALIFNFSFSFFDFNFAFGDRIAYVLAMPILALQSYALYVVFRTAPRKVWWFIFTFVGSTALMLILPDMISGGQRFTVTRYGLACYVGLQLAVVYLLTNYITAPQPWKPRFAKLIFALLIVLGLLSCGVYSQANTWWNKSINMNYHQLAAVVNASDRPLIIADAFSYYPVSLIALSYLVKPETQFLLLPQVGESFPVNDLPEEAKTIFLFNLPEVFRQQFERWAQTSLTPAFQDSWNDVWQTGKS